MHVPGQGFSEESEKFFSDLASRKAVEVDIDVLFDQSYKADHELDDVTRELRSEFALLNKIIELQEVAKQKGTKLSRKAAKAAIKEAKKASKAANKPKTVSPAKRTKPSTTEPESKWLRKICWRCGSKFSVHVDWERPQVFALHVRKTLTKPISLPLRIDLGPLDGSTSLVVERQAWASVDNYCPVGFRKRPMQALT